VFWVICFVNFGLTLIRETFNFWTPTFLHEAAGLSESGAAQYSLFVPLVGAGSVFLAGYATDYLGGRHWRIIIPSLVLLAVLLTLLGLAPLDGRPVFSICLISSISFFLIAPYSFLSGVMALDLGGKSGSSTAAGLIDSAGYFGAVVSGWGIGKIAETRGWGAAFLFLAGVALITMLAAIAYWGARGYNSRSGR
jgi:OPA family glycerol-3-phosphate transporter-like MFS transporter